ncbi:MAG: Hsp33 family molecular chaperone HslO [Acidaminococcaceae bacterium]|nr:Hsp33 family molecular chaperone HslO [Acidaminococcaceae bacterium]
MKDYLTIATVEGVRIYALVTTNLVGQAARMHHCSHVASAALGRAMTGALLLSATMKDKERVNLRFVGDGPIGEIIADAEGSKVRGYVEHPDIFLPPKNGKLDVGGAVGSGNLVVTRYLLNAEPFTGYCELKNGEIADDLTYYLYKSEQTPASVALGVLVNPEGEVVVAGGFFIQAMPGARDEVLAKLEDNVLHIPYVTQLLKMGYTPEKIIGTLGEGLQVDIKESIEVGFECRCSRQKIIDALGALDKSALQEMSEDEITEAHCDFCNTTYQFTKDEIRDILNKK